jgi:hypothetical protein
MRVTAPEMTALATAAVAALRGAVVFDPSCGGASGFQTDGTRAGRATSGPFFHGIPPRSALARQFGDFLRGQAILPGALRQVVRASAHALFWGVVLWLLVHYG